MIPSVYHSIDQIPAVLYGESSGRVWLFLHGQHGCKEEAAAFAEIACAAGARELAVDLPCHGARKARAESFTPWAVAPELQDVMSYAQGRWEEISIRATHRGLLCHAGLDRRCEGPAGTGGGTPYRLRADALLGLSPLCVSALRLPVGLPPLQPLCRVGSRDFAADCGDLCPPLPRPSPFRKTARTLISYFRAAASSACLEEGQSLTFPAAVSRLRGPFVRRAERRALSPESPLPLILAYGRISPES